MPPFDLRETIVREMGEIGSGPGKLEEIMWGKKTSMCVNANRHPVLPTVLVDVSVFL